MEITEKQGEKNLTNDTIDLIISYGKIDLRDTFNLLLVFLVYSVNLKIETS